MDVRDADGRKRLRARPRRHNAVVQLALLLLVNILGMLAIAGGQPRAADEEPGISGYVLAPDGTPVSAGTVVAQQGFASATASIETTGRFRVVARRSGFQELLIQA